MEKNTVWAIVLSTIVLVGFFAIQSIFYPVNRNSGQPAAAPAQQNTEVTSSEEKTSSFEITAFTDSDANEVLTEETHTIETNKVKVTFTNRGGDVIGYELLDHKDRDTGKGIEMANNISEKNRAYSLSFGNTDSQIINDLFNVNVIDDKTIVFTKDFVIENADKSLKKFTLAKRYSFKDDDYLFKLDIAVKGLENFESLDFDGLSYSLRTAPQIGPAFNPKDRYDIREFIAYEKDDNKKFTPKSGKDKKWNWAGLAGKYFITFINPVDTVETSGNLKLVSPGRDGSATDSQLIFARKALSKDGAEDTYYIYSGPRSEKELKKYNSAENNAWGVKETHYNEGLPTSGILSWLEVILKFVMEKINWLIALIAGNEAGNWGISIIILTIILKIALFPLTKKSLTGTKKMQELQPRMAAIQAKYKQNPQKMQQETAKLYKEIGYNPMAGCLPLIFQFVILWSMYHLFNNYFEFRGAMFVPGWIPDLSTSDHVYTLGFNIPLLGNDIHILPVIYLVSQLLYGKITQNGGTAVGQKNGQMKFMMYGMPIIFFFLFYSAPSGLLLYWTVSNIIQLIQQLLINRTMAKTENKAVSVKNKK